jgi:hypothetical protein
MDLTDLCAGRNRGRLQRYVQVPKVRPSGPVPNGLAAPPTAEAVPLPERVIGVCLRVFRACVRSGVWDATAAFPYGGVRISGMIRR